MNRVVIAGGTFVGLWMWAHGAGAQQGGGAPPSTAGRPRVFATRNTVVKESRETAVLAGREVPVTIVTGRDAAAGPREEFENRQMVRAGGILSRYLEKITGAPCTVVESGSSTTPGIPDGGFEEPARGASPNPEWPPLAGRWFTYLNRAGSAEVQLAKEPGGNTVLTARGVVPGSGTAGACRPLAMEKGQKYKLSLRYRSRLEAPAVASVLVTRMEPAVSLALPDSKDWKRVEIAFVASQAEASLIVGLQKSRLDEDQVWFDDIALAKEGGPAPGASATGRRIFVGATGHALAEFPELVKADDHGFVIATRGGDLHIVGRCGTATLYGVWYFLYNYAGLRVVMPGEIGEIYEKTPALAIPKDLHVVNPGPDFLLRIISQKGFDPTSWLQDASGTERFLYHHAFGRVLPPGKFGKTDPELYPVLGGKRHIPSEGKSTMWQPTFSEPKLVDHVLRHAEEAFAANPQLKSISVTPNDGEGYSELDTKEGMDGWRRHYYAFVNAVARGVARRWPGRYVALLSYGALKVPPESKLEDNAMLFLFSYQGNVQETYAEWKGKVANFGVYQWLYGGGWLMPSHGPHAVQDYLRFVRGIGGRAFKGEACINFAQDGARMWVLSNLLWDADADVDALLMDYLVACYGREAAPAMSRFLAQSEKIYERRRTPTRFNLNALHPGGYQFQGATDEDFRLMGEAMDEAGRKVTGEGNRTRLAAARRGFEVCRLYWETHRSLKAVEGLAAKGFARDADAEALLAEAAAFAKGVDTIWSSRAFQAGARPPGPDTQGDHHEYWLGSGFKWGKQHEVVASALGALTAERRKTRSSADLDAFWKEAGERLPDLKLFSRQQRGALLPPETRLRNLLSNGGFEQAAAPDEPAQKSLLERFQKQEYQYTDWNDYRLAGMPCRDWVHFSRLPIDLTVGRDEAVCREGRASLRVSGAGYYGGVLHHFVPPDPRACYRLSFWYKTEGAIGHGICGVAFYKVWGFESTAQAFSAAPDWRRVEMVFTANSPPEVAPCTLALYLQGSKPDAKIWFDDVRVEMLAPEGVEAP